MVGGKNLWSKISDGVGSSIRYIKGTVRQLGVLVEVGGGESCCGGYNIMVVV